MGSQTPLPQLVLNWVHWVELRFDGHGYEGALGRRGATEYPWGMYPKYFEVVVLDDPEPVWFPAAPEEVYV